MIWLWCDNSYDVVPMMCFLCCWSLVLMMMMMISCFVCDFPYDPEETRLWRDYLCENCDCCLLKICIWLWFGDYLCDMKNCWYVFDTNFVCSMIIHTSLRFSDIISYFRFTLTPNDTVYTFLSKISSSLIPSTFTFIQGPQTSSLYGHHAP